MADQSSSKIPNPRGKKSGDRRLSPRSTPSSAMWYVLGFLLLLALANAFFFSLQSGQTLSYSDFKTAVREGRMDYEGAGRLLRFYEDGLHGYTYLEG